MLQGVTVGLQEVTRGFRQLQGLTGGYGWLWYGMVTRGHRLQGNSSGYRGNSGLEVVTGGYKGLQGVTMGFMKI